jgi:hypothetical protein
MGIGGQANENPLGGFGSFGGWTDLIPGKFLKVQLEPWRNFDEPSLTRVEGYASSDSVAAGQSIDICAETEQIYRGRYFFQFSVRIDRCGIADFTFEGAGVGRPQATARTPRVQDVAGVRRSRFLFQQLAAVACTSRR